MDPREVLADWLQVLKLAVDRGLTRVWTSLPVQVMEDSDGHICTIQPTIKAHHIKRDGSTEDIVMPNLGHTPVHFASGGGFTITHPIKKGDEGICVFSARNLDGWFDQGGVQPQPYLRKHNLSDSMYIPGIRSNPRKLGGQTSQGRSTSKPPSTTSVQIRTDSGDYFYELTPTDINTVAQNATHNVVQNNSRSAGGVLTINAAISHAVNAGTVIKMIAQTAGAAAPARLIGGILNSAEQAIGAFQAITNGSFQVAIDGVVQQVTGLNLSAVQNLTDVATQATTALNSAMGVVGSMSWLGQSFSLSSAMGGVNSAVGFLSAIPGVGQDISAMLKMTQALAGNVVAGLGPANNIFQMLAKGQIALTAASQILHNASQILHNAPNTTATGNHTVNQNQSVAQNHTVGFNVSVGANISFGGGLGGHGSGFSISTGTTTRSPTVEMQIGPGLVVGPATPPALPAPPMQTGDINAFGRIMINGVPIAAGGTGLPYVPTAGGTISGTAPGTLFINRNPVLPLAPSGIVPVLRVVGNDTENPAVVIDGFGLGAGGQGTVAFMMRVARGSAGSPSAVQHGDSLGIIAWRGYGATVYGSGAAIRITGGAYEPTISGGLWTDQAQGAQLSIATNLPGTVNNPVTQVQIGPGLTVGSPPAPTTAPTSMQTGDINASGRIMINGVSIVTGGPYLPTAGGTISPGPLIIAGNSTTFAQVQLNNTSIANNAALWRINVGLSGNINVQLNTATLGDFSTNVQPLQVRASDQAALFSGSLFSSGSLTVGTPGPPTGGILTGDVNASRLLANRATVVPPTIPAGTNFPQTPLRLTGADGDAVVAGILEGIGNKVWAFYHYNTSTSGPTAPTLNQNLGSFAWRGFGGASAAYQATYAARISCFAAENFDDAHGGASIGIFTTPIGLTGPVSQMTIGGANGGVAIGVPSAVQASPVAGDLNAVRYFLNGAPLLSQATGTTTRTGTAGPNTAHVFNIDYTGSIANLWIDGSNFGQLITGAVSGFLPLTGGNLSGPLTGTTASFSGEIVSTLGPGNYGGLRLTGGNYGAIFRQDGSNLYFLLTPSGAPLGTWNTLRPLQISVSTGAVTMSNGLWLYNAALIIGSGAGDPGSSSTQASLGTTRWRLQQTSGDESNAGVIDYRSFDTNALSIVGAGTTSPNRLIHLWDNVTLGGTLTVGGTMTATGGISGTGYAMNNTGLSTSSAAFSANIWPTVNNAQYCGYGGNAWASVGSYAYPSMSDPSLKRDIVAIPTGCLDLVQAIEPKMYKWADAKIVDEADRVHWGFLAPEVADVMEKAGHRFDAVSLQNGIYTLGYNEMIAVLWGAVRELAAAVAAVKGAAPWVLRW